MVSRRAAPSRLPGSARSAFSRPLCPSGFAGRELGEGLAPVAEHSRAAVAFVVHDDEVAAGPRPVQEPRAVEGAAEVEPTLDEPSGDAGKPVGVREDLISLEPGVVPPTMSDLAGEAEPEPRVVVNAGFAAPAPSWLRCVRIPSRTTLARRPREPPDLDP